MKTYLPIFVLAFCIPYCEVGGGESSSSVTVPGEDGVYVKAQVDGKLPCRIEMERWTGVISGSGEVRYIFNKSLTQQELRLFVGEKKDSVFILAKHDEASSYTTHKLEVSPDGKRVAYKLDDGPWSVVYAPTPDFAVHAKPEYKTLDWGKIPTLEQAFVDVYDAQSLRLDGKFRFDKKAQLVDWLRKEKGEAAVIKVMLNLMSLSSDTTFNELVASLSPQGRTQLGAEIFRRLPTSDSPRFFDEAWEQGFIDLDDPANLDVIRRGLRMMTKTKDDMVSSEVAADAYLRAYARQSPQEAGEFACKLRSGSKLPFPLEKGRPLHVSTLAAPVAAGIECPAAEALTYEPCHEKTLCDGQFCTPDYLKDLAAQQLKKHAVYNKDNWKIEEAVCAKLAIANQIASGAYTKTKANAECGGVAK